MTGIIQPYSYKKKTDEKDQLSDSDKYCLGDRDSNTTAWYNVKPTVSERGRLSQFRSPEEDVLIIRRFSAVISIMGAHGPDETRPRGGLSAVGYWKQLGSYSSVSRGDLNCTIGEWGA